MDEKRLFLSVHDLNLSPDERRIWGSLPRTPEGYASNGGASPYDSALAHIINVCLNRGNMLAARYYASMIADPRMRGDASRLINTADSDLADSA